MKRALIVLALVLALGVASVWWFRREQAASGGPEVAFTYVAAERLDLRQTVTINGTITPVLSTEIKSEVNGRIAAVLVSAGDAVEAGQRLVELDPGSLQAQRDEAQLGIEAARLRFERAQKELERMEMLAGRDFVNAHELETSRTDFLLAKNEFEARGARVRIIEDNLKKITLTAPYAGTVLGVAARPGMVVTGAESGRDGMTLMEIADLTRLRVEANINEIDVASLRLGMPVEISFESVRDLRAGGRITFISPASLGGTAAGSGAGRSRDFPLQISVDDATERVKPGMTARVRIETARADGATALPITAVFLDFETDEAYVFVRRASGEPERRTVEIGVRSGSHVQIVSGLGEGEEVSLQKPAAERAPAPEVRRPGRG